jgi:hypothetical protein
MEAKVWVGKKGRFNPLQRGVKAYVWFYDPFAGRNALLESGDQDEAMLDGARSCSPAGVSPSPG